MVKIFKLNESYGNWTGDELIKFVTNIEKLKEGCRRYIIWKENVDVDDDVLVKEITVINNNIWIEYSNVDWNEKDYEIQDINELVKFLNDPQFYYQQDKYNL